jgi:hypothetical protein
VDYYDSEYRRQSCRDRIERIRDDYRRAQRQSDAQPRHRISIVMRSAWERIRRQIPERVPAYRS